MTRRRIRLAWMLVSVLVLALFTAIISALSPQFPGDQGCVNQGADSRIFAMPICSAQRHLSWKSEKEPSFLSIGNPSRVNLGLA